METAVMLRLTLSVYVFVSLLESSSSSADCSSVINGRDDIDAERRSLQTSSQSSVFLHADEDGDLYVVCITALSPCLSVCLIALSIYC